jgi:hypothetical protein
MHRMKPKTALGQKELAGNLGARVEAMSTLGAVLAQR